MVVIPNTQIAVTFLDIPAGGLPPLYYHANESGDALASLNAGNSNGLWLGGGGINLAFDKVLRPLGQDTDDYGKLHLALAAKAGDNGTAFEAYSSGNPMAFSYVRNNKIIDIPGWHEGVCFVDVFGAGYLPHNNAKNFAMLYACPPHADNHVTQADFLTAITDTATNIAATVTGYNAIAAAQGQPAIEALRLCLYSSGIYNEKSSNPGVRFVAGDAIARAIYAGLSAELQKQSSGLSEIQLPCSPAALFSAVKQDLTGSVQN